MSRKPVLVAAAVLSLTLGAVVASNGSSAAPGGGDRQARISAHQTWPTSSSISLRKALKQARAAARADGGQVLVLEERTLRERFVDVGNPGDSPGDSIVFESALFTRAGERAGRDVVRCTFGIRTFICDGTFQVTGSGKLTAYGAFFGAEPQVTVTGGTRAFVGTAGQLIPVSRQNGDFLVFQLIR